MSLQNEPLGICGLSQNITFFIYTISHAFPGRTASKSLTVVSKSPSQYFFLKYRHFACLRRVSKRTFLPVKLGSASEIIEKYLLSRATFFFSKMLLSNYVINKDDRFMRSGSGSNTNTFKEVV